MRVVVVGATGNLGTAVVRLLGEAEEVASIVGLARRLPRWCPAKTTWVTADLKDATETELAGHFRDADAVVHLAWLFQPTRDPATTWRTNVLGSLRVFRAVAEVGVPALVYASSVGAYSPRPADDSPVAESWPTHGWPSAAYSREKAYLERALDAFETSEAGVRVVRMRPGFLFRPEAATEQRRLFLGPFFPGRLARPGLVPVVPDIPGLRFQALHTDDAAAAFREALVRPVRGAFNLASDPVVDTARLAELLGARPVRTPVPVVRAMTAAAWHLRAVPASPGLFDLVMRLPLMNVDRARTELDWRPRWSSLDALRGLLSGLRAGEGMDTPPLDPRTSGPLRLGELRSGLGRRP